MTPGFILLALSIFSISAGLTVIMRSKLPLDRFGVMLAGVGLCVLWVSVVAIGVEQQAKRELGSGGATSPERSTETGRALPAPPAQLSPECLQ